NAAEKKAGGKAHRLIATRRVDQPDSTGAIDQQPVRCCNAPSVRCSDITVHGIRPVDIPRATALGADRSPGFHTYVRQIMARSPSLFVPQQTSSRPSTITRSSIREQKLTSPPPSLLTEKQMLNGCSGFNGTRNLTARMAVRRESSGHPVKAATISSRITTPGTTGAPAKCPSKLG